MNTSKLKKRSVCDMQTVLKLPQGRRVLWQLLQAAQVRAHGFVPADALATAFHCGQRSLGLFLLDQIEEAAPGAYQQMRREFMAEVTSLQNQMKETEND